MDFIFASLKKLKKRGFHFLQALKSLKNRGLIFCKLKKLKKHEYHNYIEKKQSLPT